MGMIARLFGRSGGQELGPGVGYRKRLKVLPRETLRSIAQREYGDERKWEIIFEKNKRRFVGEDPAAMYPGMVLDIPESGEVRLEFGATVPVTVTSEAEILLGQLPWPALGQVLEALRNWAQHVPLKAARARVVSDWEDADWREVVIELRIDADSDAALGLWDEMEKALADAKKGLPPDQRSELDRHLGVHLLWGADSWDVE